MLDTRKRKRKQPEQSVVTSEAAGCLVWIPENDRFTIRKSEPSSKRLKQASAKVTIEDIQGAYEDARRQGTLQSPYVPQLRQNTSSTAHWDPYIIPANRLNDALLDEDKLKSLHSEIRKVTRRVPLAAKWMVQTQAKSLTPADIRTIIQTAFGTVPRQPRLLLDNDISTILAIGSTLLHYADHLDAQKRIFPRGVLVTRLIGFSVMRVYEALAPEDNEKVSVAYIL